MILDTAHDEGLAIQLIENPANIRVQVGSKDCVPQKPPALFGGEDHVDEDLG